MTSTTETSVRKGDVIHILFAGTATWPWTVIHRCPDDEVEIQSEGGRVERHPRKVIREWVKQGKVRLESKERES